MVSLDPKYDELKNLYKLLSDFENHKPIINKTKSHKDMKLLHQAKQKVKKKEMKDKKSTYHQKKYSRLWMT